MSCRRRRGVVGAARREGALRALVIHDGQAELLEVVDALRTAGRLAGGLDGGQQQGDQDGDDGDDDQKLDQGETATILHLK